MSAKGHAFALVCCTHVLVLETGEDFDFPQRALAIRLMLERGDLLDCHLCVCGAVERRSKMPMVELKDTNTINIHS